MGGTRHGLAKVFDLEDPGRNDLDVLTDQNDLDGQLFDTFARCSEHIR